MKKLLIVAFSCFVVYTYGQNFVTTDKWERDAVKETLSKARKGNAEAQYKIGMYYLKGTVIQKDLKKSEEWLAKACENYYRQAYEPAADVCVEIIKSPDLEINIFEAVAYYNRAQNRYEKAVTSTTDDKVRERIADKMTSLCISMRNAMEQDFKDLKETDGDFLTLKNAADYGSLEAAGFIALFYEGKGKIEQSIPYFIKAAEKGDFISQARVGQYLYKKKEYSQAFRYLKMACTNPDEEDVWDFVHENSILISESGEIMQMLARCYRFGYGTAEKPKIAELWDLLSAFYASSNGQDLGEVNGIDISNPVEMMKKVLLKFQPILKKRMDLDNSAKILYYLSHINNQTIEAQNAFQSLISLSDNTSLKDMEKAFIFDFLSKAYEAAATTNPSEQIKALAAKYKRLSTQYEKDEEELSKWICSTLRLSLTIE